MSLPPDWMSMLRPLVMLVALAIALAGCGSKEAAGAGEARAEAAAQGLSLQATPTAGVLRGYVLDPALHPVAGAEAELGGFAQASSGADGAFGFEGIPAGAYFLTVAKAGFHPVRLPVEVHAGVDHPEAVKVLLEPSGRAPFVEETLYRGFMDAAVGVGLLGSSNHLTASATSAVTGEPGDFRTDVPVQGDDVAWVQHELRWDATTQTGAWLDLACTPQDAEGDAAGETAQAVGPSPLSVSFGAEALAGLGGNGTSECWFLSGAASDPAGAGLSLLQHVDAYTHVFHGYRPPAGWTFGRDGPSPP